MDWTTEPPTEPGYYWCRTRWRYATVVEVAEENGHLVVYEMGRDDTPAPPDWTEYLAWSGPLTAP